MSHPTPRTPPLRPPARTPRHPAHAARLGWDHGWQHSLDALADSHGEGVVLGRICRVDAGACDVLVPEEHGIERVTARWASRVHHGAADDPTALPATGDWAVLVPHAGDQRDAPWALAATLPRRTALERLGVSGTSDGQVLAANADVVAVVEGMVPDLDLGRLERLLALAWSSGARPAVLLTKADLHPDPAQVVAMVTASAAGCDVLAVSAPDDQGLAEPRRWLAEGATVALLGASGVGKSTLLNALVGEQAMTTRSLGVEGKGRHTTVTRELHLAPDGGAVLDTPGLRSVGLRGDEAVDEVFADVVDLAATCRFGDCSHTVEPGCAVLAAIDDGSLPERRLASYRALEREAAFQARRTDARLRAEHAKVWKARARAYRARPDKKR